MQFNPGLNRKKQQRGGEGKDMKEGKRDTEERRKGGRIKKKERDYIW